MKRRMMMFLSVLLVIVSAFAVLVACVDPNRESGDEAGTYYCENRGTEDTLVLGENCSFTLTIGADERSGSYELEGEALTLTSKEGEIAATLKGDTVTLTYESVTYQFLKKIDYTVVFDTNGNGTVPNATVVNGKPVAKPENPVKEGYVFVAWYTDAELRSAYDFSQPVRGDLHLYAMFVEKLDPEFTVTFDVNGGAESFDPVQTAGGKLYELPTPTLEGDKFAGWWVSHSNSADKLTYQYDGRQLFENTTLYAVWESSAPLVSITEKGMSWSASGLNNNFRFKLTDPDGATIEMSESSATSYDFNFADAPEGEYTGEVTLNGKTTRAYYMNKALARVSVFEVTGCMLQWNEVPGAEKYILSYQCASGHDHTAIECAEASYDFSACEMPEGGFVFNVTAAAEGHVSSEASFSFDRSLPAASDLSYDAEKESAVWTAVPGATSYTVDVRQNGKSIEGFPVNVTEPGFDLKGLVRGSYTVTVTPKAHGWRSPAASEATFDKARLSAPTNIVVQGSHVTWDPVDGATKYEVTFNGMTYYDIEEERFELMDSYIVEGQTEYNFSVRAIADTAAGNSLQSDTVVVHTGTIENVAYRNGVLSWDAMWGANTYLIQIDGDEQSTPANRLEGITFDASGDHTLRIAARRANGTQSEWAELTVTAYAIYFNVGTGHDTTPVETVYMVYGDSISMADFVTTRVGYDFVNWYTQEENGDVYNDTVFEQTSDLTLYAHWTPRAFTVTFVVDENYAAPIPAATVYYEQPVSLGTPDTIVNDQVFLGWYDQPNGSGLAITDYTGNGEPYKLLQDITVYANFGVAFSWEEIKSGQNAGFRVSKNAATANSVVSLRIPYMHNGKLVTEVSDFSSMPNLESISIPSTVKVISLASGSVAFRDSAKLRNVEIYSVPQEQYPHIPEYSSYDGAVYQTTDGVGTKLVYVPVAYAGKFTVMPGTDSIPGNAFYMVKEVTEVVLPSSVVSVETEAFRNCSAIQRIVFLDTAEGEEAQPLDISDNAFYSLSALTELVLPARLTKFSSASVYLCSQLANIRIGTDKGEGTLGQYTSIDGMLCKVIDGGLELTYIGRGRTSLDLSTRFVSIGEGAFGVITGADGKVVGSATGNSTIETVVIPGSVTHIGRSAFRGGTKISTLTFLGTSTNEPLIIEDYAFYGVGTSGNYLKEVTLPANLQNLGVRAFGGIERLTKVNVESANPQFSDGAFASTSDTYYVTNVYLGKEVTDLNIPGVFGPNVKAVEVHKENDNFTALEDGVLYNKAVTSIRFYPSNRDTTEYETPETLEEIPANTFTNFERLTKITIGKNVQTIGDRAFYQCVNLREIVFEPDGEKPLTIGAEAFSSTNSVEATQVKLKSIDLPDRTTVIGESAFSNMSSLTSFTMPSTLEQFGGIGEKATVLDGSSNVTAINVRKVEGKTANWYSQDGILYRCNEKGEATAIAFAPIQCAVTSIVVPGTVRVIWEGAFASNRSIKKITFAERAKDEEGNPIPLEIRSLAFDVCTSLETIDLPEGIEEIADQAFYYCRGLQSISIPASVKRIGVAAFMWCEALTSITFPEKMDGELEIADADKILIGTQMSGPYGAFYGDKMLESIKFPEGLVKVGTMAFKGCVSLAKVEFPASLLSIGADAFAASSSEHGGISGKLGLQTVTFAPDSKLQYIYDYAFYYCENLTSIKLPDSVIQIYDHAFSYTGLTSIDLPKSLVSLGQAAGSSITGWKAYTGWNYGNVFANTPLEHVTFGDSLVNIGSGVFAGTLIDEVSLPKTIKNIYQAAFSTLPTLKSVKFADGTVLADGSATDPSLPKNVFLNCTNLQTVDFGKGSIIKIIGDSAFSGCSSLESITIPASTVTIQSNAFALCTHLATIEWEKDEKGELKESNLASVGTSGATAVTNVFRKAPVEKIVFPASTSSITLQMGIFNQCPNLHEIYFSKSIATVGGAFKGCTSLTFITVDPENKSFSSKEGEKLLFDKNGESIYLVYSELGEEGITIKAGASTIGAGAFAGQVNIKKIIIPRTVTTIDANAFENCIDLQEVEIEAGSSLSTIGAGAFLNCTSLTSINLSNAKSLKELAVGKSTTGVFQGCSSLSSVDMSGCTALAKIGDYAFYKCPALETVKFPAALTTIGGYAFQGCTELGEVDLSACNKFTTMGNYVFSGCSSLTTAKLPASASGFTKTGNYIFEDCTSLRNVTFSNTLTTLGNYFFDNCASLTSVTLPSALTDTGTYTFHDCAQLTTVVFPAGLKTINTGAFSGCTLFGSVGGPVTLPASLTTINGSAFKDCASLTLSSSNLPSSLKDLKSSAFEGCKGLTEVIIPAGVTTVSSKAFYNCSNITSITFASGSKCATLDTDSFRGTGISSIDLPECVKEIKAGAFADCAVLATVNFADSGSNGLYITGNTSTSELKPDSTTSVSPFANTKITSLSFPKTRDVYLNNGALAYCTSLREIAEWGGIRNIGNSAFCGSGIESIVIPAVTIRQYSSTASPTATANLSLYVFENCTNLKSISFAEGFGESAVNTSFAEGCTALETVDFTNAGSLKYIGSYAFDGCTSLKGSAKNEDGTFEPLDLSPLTALLYLGGSFDVKTNLVKAPTQSSSGSWTNNSTYMFRGCSSLEKVILPDDLVDIGTYAFNGCTKLTTIEGLDHVTNLHNYSLTGTAIRTSEADGEGTFRLPASVAYLGTNVFQNTSTENFDLSSYAGTALPNYTFAGNTKLKSVTLPTGLTSLGSYTFDGCSSLEGLTLPAGVTSIGINVFNGCSKLSEENIDISKVVSIDDYAFARTAFKSPDLKSVVSLSVFAFDGCEINFEEALTVQEGFALSGSTVFRVLDSAKDENGVITVPNGYALGEYSFRDVEAEKVVLPEGLTEIPAYTFYNANIKEIVLPKTGSYFFRGHAFEGTVSDELTVPANATFPYAYVFANTKIRKVTFLGDGELSDRMYTFQGAEVEEVVLPNGMTRIYSYFFDGCTKLTSVTIPDTVATIGSNVFRDTPLLKELTLPAALTTGATSASSAPFAGSGVTTLTFKGATVPKYLAYNAENLTTVKFEGELTTIEDNAFQNCAVLTTIELPETLESIGASAFKGCTALTTVGNKLTGLKTIGGNAFESSGLTTLEFGDQLETIGASAFKASKLTSLVIPESVTKLNSAMFSECADLTSVVFNNTYEMAFPATVFQNCTSLSSVKMPAGVIEYGANTFTGCTALTKLWLPNTVVKINANNFTGWTDEQTIYCEMTRFELFSMMDSMSWLLTDVHSAKIAYGVSEEQFNQLP